MYPSYTSLVSISYMIVYFVCPSFSWRSVTTYTCLNKITSICMVEYLISPCPLCSQYNLCKGWQHQPVFDPVKGSLTDGTFILVFIHTCIIVYIMCIGHLYIMYIFSNLTRSLFVDNYSVNWLM